ncbi:MAG TPA: PQQ-binding-like beta-propeller repeat protein, partial [Planctomycetaceae bacterium]|nr:PQQ-binding-like beta-propeller repeat protein [Planctomycetaceae bacterium]
KSEISNARARHLLFVPDASTLVTASGTTIAAHSAADGEQLWTLNVAPTGNITGGQLSVDGKTLVLKTDTDGGRVIVIRDQKIIGTIFQPADVALPTPDGRFVAVTHERQLKWYSAEGQFVWQFTGDEFLRNPEMSHDGQKIAVCSELGTLTTLSAAGEVLGENDVRALAALKFLQDGDLIAATWTGNLMRFQAGVRGLWMQHYVPFSVRIRGGNEPKMPGERDIKFQFGPLPDNRIWMGWPLTKVVPTTRMADWGNAAKEPAPLEPNLLSDTQALIQAWCDPPTHGDPRDWRQPIELLTDGKPDAPPRPWLEWSDINYIDSGWRQKLTLVVDTFREQLKV